jgi:progesterone-induced-blocking factor 1
MANIQFQFTPHHGSKYFSKENSIKLHNGGKLFTDNKQIKHDVQLMKIKLSEKDMLLNNLNQEYASKIEYLEENLNDTLQQNQILNKHLNDIVNVSIIAMLILCQFF